MTKRAGAQYVLLFALSLAPACSKPNADRHVQKAEAFVQRSRLPEAVVEYRLALQADPNRGDIRLKLADAYSLMRDAGNAQREYLRAAEQLPSDVSAQLRAGNILLQTRRFTDARNRADAVLELDPKNVDAQILRGNALAALKDMDGAIRDYQAAIALNPSKESAYLNMGAIQSGGGRRSEAEASFRKAVEVAPTSVAAKMALANFFWATGRIAESESVLKEAVSLDPANLAANRAMGMFYVSAKRPAEAEPYFKTIARTANTTAASLSLADYYLAVERFDEARALLGEIAKKDDGYAPATMRVAALDASNGKRDVAVATLQQVLQKHPNDMAVRLLTARILLLDGKRDEALTMATSIVTDEPMAAESADAYLLIGTVQTGLDRIDEAIKSYEEILKRETRPFAANLALAGLSLKTGAVDKASRYAENASNMQPSHPQARAMKIRVLLAKRQFAKAKTELEALQREFPNSPVVMDLLAAQHANDGRVDSARAAYMKAVSRAPNDLEALAGLVSLDLKAGKPRDAVARVETALKTPKPSATLLMLAGKTYGAAGEMAKAEELLKRAIDTDPKRLQAYTLLGTLYFKQRKLDAANAQFQQIVKLNPRSTSANTMLAMLMEAQGRVSEAEQQYQKILVTDPEAVVAANNLAWMYVSNNRNLDEALRLAQSAKVQLPDEPHVNDTLGWIYYRKNLPASAIPHLELSVEKDPNDPLTHYHLGMAYAQVGRAALAKRELQRALEFKVTFEGEAEARKALAGLGS